jgi:hypothetical protein
LEGFIEARVLVDALRRCGGNITREVLVDTLERVGRWEIGGYTVEHGKGMRSGSAFVEMAIIEQAEDCLSEQLRCEDCWAITSTSSAYRTFSVRDMPCRKAH